METPRHISLVFGTRPEIIKLSPVFAALNTEAQLKLTCTFTGQQADLAPEFLREFDIPVANVLDTMQPGQNIAQLTSTLITKIEQVLCHDKPDAVVVQGDTTSALAGAMVANFLNIPVMHVEAGLRTFDADRPFPEETNRVLIAQLANHHFAATEGNRANLMREGIAPDEIYVTGNPVVDIVTKTLDRTKPSPISSQLSNRIKTTKFIVLTAHRRENFDFLLDAYFQVIIDFINSNADYTLVAPIHPNPTAKEKLMKYFARHPRVLLVEPLGYRDFLCLLSNADLAMSDSGGIQEEAASVGTSLIILRELTERPEALAADIAKLAPDAVTLENLLKSFATKQTIGHSPTTTPNPFGDGESGPRIAKKILEIIEQSHAS